MKKFRCFLLATSVAIAAPSLLLAQTSGPVTTIPDKSNWDKAQNYQTSFGDYLTNSQGKSFDVVFIGDSITEKFRWGPGKFLWDKHFAASSFNFGQGGDRTQNVLWRLQNLPIQAIKPKVAVLLIGTNNHQDSVDDIVTGIRAVIAQTKVNFPGIKIILLSILPNERAKEKMAEVNQRLPELEKTDGVRYLDIASRFTPKGDNWKGISSDKLHLTTEGYALWAEALNPVLADALKKSP